MANRLEPVNLVDFTGGLNLRRNQFQLRGNESPEMENITVDPLGGIYTRAGWRRWNEEDIVADPETWDPRRAYLIQTSDGSDYIYIANGDGTVYWSDAAGTFAALAGVTAQCVPHAADFVAWGDDLYIACGHENTVKRRTGTAAVVAMVAGGSGSWNDDYTNPGAMGLVVPKCELIESHAGYIFVANIDEDGVDFPNRVRWSHPNNPTDFATLDFLDVETGGPRITALMSYEDHLLVFKNDAVVAIYGYDLDSWQVVTKTTTIGAVSPQGVSRSEGAVFFYSASDRGGIYAYSGERPHEISESVRHAFEHIITHDLVWVGWLARRLWVTIPWTYDGPTADNAAVLVFDPIAGEAGAWVYFTAVDGQLGPLVAGSNVDSQFLPLGVIRATDTPCVVQLDAIETAAADELYGYSVLGSTNSNIPGDPLNGFLVDESDNELEASGLTGGSAFRSYYRTPWITADWPTRKKSWRRPDLVCRGTEEDYKLQVRSYRDYDDSNTRRQYTVDVNGRGIAKWGEFVWGDGTEYSAGGSSSAQIRRGGSFGLGRAIQLRFEGITPKRRWGVEAIVLKVVLRRFR